MRAQAGPIRKSYWVVPNRLLAGPYPGARGEESARGKVRDLLEAGVTFFLDLTEQDELLPYRHLLPHQTGRNGRPPEYRRKPIRDCDIPTHTDMVHTLDTIDGALEAGHTVYVHCWGGTGRTGTVVGCYLARHGKPGGRALSAITRLREPAKTLRRSPETAAQVEMVLRWPEGK